MKSTSCPAAVRQNVIGVWAHGLPGAELRRARKWANPTSKGKNFSVSMSRRQCGRRHKAALPARHSQVEVTRESYFRRSRRSKFGHFVKARDAQG